jgi:hypothetical protein
MSPSTAAPEAMPKIDGLRRLTKSLAMLDAIICPEWALRFYSYNAKWGAGEEMASMRDGCGDEWFILFDRAGVALKGFAHEARLAGDDSLAKRIPEVVPSAFASFLNEPAFSLQEATFCLWCSVNDPAWNVVTPPGGRVSPSEDGSDELLRLLDGLPETYQRWAEAYYEQTVPLEAVKAIYAHQTLETNLIDALNPARSLSDITADADEIGYPLPS